MPVSANYFFAVALHDVADGVYGFFGRRVYAFEFVGVAAQRPFVRAKFMIGQEFHVQDVVHRRDVLPEQMRAFHVVAVAGHDNVAHPRGLLARGKVFGKAQGAGIVVRDLSAVF